MAHSGLHRGSDSWTSQHRGNGLDLLGWDGFAGDIFGLSLRGTGGSSAPISEEIKKPVIGCITNGRFFKIILDIFPVSVYDIYS